MADLQPLIRRTPGAFPPIDDALPPMPTLSGMGGALPPIVPLPTPQITSNPLMVANSTDPLVNKKSGLEADLYKRSNPIAPTTTLGKIGHVAGKIGNVLGDIFAPDVMANIPGTQLYNERIMERDKADLADVSKEQTAEAARKQSAATTAYTEQRPEIEQAKILQKLTSSLAPKGIIATMNPDGTIDTEDDVNSQAYKNQQALAGMHQATQEKDQIQSEIAKNHYLPGTPEYAEAQRKLAQVDSRLHAALAGLGLRAQGLQLRKNDQQANFYGIGPDGRPLPNAPQFEDSEGNTVTGGLKGAARAVDQQTKAVTFNDLRGSVAHVRQTLQDLYNSGGSLSDAGTIAAFEDPTSMTGKFVKGKLVQPNLSPQAVAAVNALNQLHEQASILRKTTGGTAAEAQAERILRTVPQAGDADNISLGKLGEVDTVLDRLGAAAPPIAGGVKVKKGTGSAGVKKFNQATGRLE